MAKSLAKVTLQEVDTYIQELNQTSGLSFTDAFTSTGIADRIAEAMPNSRNCSWDPLTTTMAFVSQVIHPDKSCSDAVIRNNADRVAAGKKQLSSATGAYVIARQRLPVGLMGALSHDVADKLEKMTPHEWHWKGRSVKIVDGSTLTMADTPENQAEWPQHAQQGEGLGFPIIRLVALFSLATGAVLGLEMDAFQGKGTGEHALFRRLLSKLEENDIILGDSYYPSWFLLQSLINKGIDGVFSQHGARHTDFRKGEKLGPMDHTVFWPKPPKPEWMSKTEYVSLPNKIKIREIQLPNSFTSSGENLIIVTTLTDSSDFSVGDANELYGWRWNAELDLRNLKTTMSMEHLSCKSPDMIRKELEAHLLAYNLIRLLMCQSSIQEGCEPRNLSFKGAIQSFNAFSPLIQSSCDNKMICEQLWCVMLTQISSRKVGMRQGRSEPRAIKKRPRTFPRLSKKRALYSKTSII